MLEKKKLIAYYDEQAASIEKWRKRNRLYHKTLEKYCAFVIPEGSRVLEIGSGNGDLLNAVKPSRGVGIDFSEKMVALARKKYPGLEFLCMDGEQFSLPEKFDYILLSDIFCTLVDIQAVLKCIRPLVSKHTRLVISNYNYLWTPVLKLGERMGLKSRQPLQNWLSFRDIELLLTLESFESIKVERKLLFPKYIPILNWVCNTFFANLPLINHLNVIFFIIARPVEKVADEFTVSIVIPARNEEGNIENAIQRIPKFGRHQEFIFVEGNSKDNTMEAMLRVKEKYPGHDIKIIKQTGKGKGNAVREGFEMATGDILMILDADLTTPPEDMPKFYDAIARNHGEFINGCRLVYPMEKQAMRFLNLLGNTFFGWLFTYLLGQRLKDTLCGTKVLFREDYFKIKTNRNYFGDFDPFGDFDLLFGASKLNLKIVEVIVRYRDREYGTTQISRFKHGWLLLKMCFFAAFKLKFK
ncbi:MAG: methyltransferase protein [Bacteroidetes bacterium]|nr:methyltransferase protein [Bacteroidota bacterium]